MLMLTKALLLLMCVVFARGYARTVTGNLTVSNGGTEGIWGSPTFCADGTFAVGYTMKIESQQFWDDDTSVNGIKIFCDSLDGSLYGGAITSTVGDFGTWKTGETRCDKATGVHHFLTAFALQVEHYQVGSDNTGVNWIKFKCIDFAANENAYELSRSPGHGHVGADGNFSGTCPADSAICGLSTKVQSWQGDKADDTALNDVMMFCCNN